MFKRTLAGCVAVMLLLSSAGTAGAAPSLPEATLERDALTLNETGAPIGIHIPVPVSPVGFGLDEMGDAPGIGNALAATTVADATPAAIPLPAGVYVGLVGLASTFAAWRRFKRRRI